MSRGTRLAHGASYLGRGKQEIDCGRFALRDFPRDYSPIPGYKSDTGLRCVKRVLIISVSLKTRQPAGQDRNCCVHTTVQANLAVTILDTTMSYRP